jgi:hypothetical protein
MHIIKTNFDIFYWIRKEIFKKENDRYCNFRIYPRKPELSALQLITLICLMEVLAIDP